MKEILLNLAMIDLNAFCAKSDINYSGTYVVKLPRKFTYAMKKEETGKTIATVTFTKYCVPTHVVHPN